MLSQPTVKEVHRMLEEYLHNRSDLGVWNAVANRIMVPGNPFESKSIGRPQQWLVLFSGSFLAAVIAFLYFNFWN
jgi:hypothetical protein